MKHGDHPGLFRPAPAFAFRKANAKVPCGGFITDHDRKMPRRPATGWCTSRISGASSPGSAVRERATASPRLSGFRGQPARLGDGRPTPEGRGRPGLSSAPGWLGMAAPGRGRRAGVQPRCGGAVRAPVGPSPSPSSCLARCPLAGRRKAVGLGGPSPVFAAAPRRPRIWRPPAAGWLTVRPAHALSAAPPVALVHRAGLRRRGGHAACRSSEARQSVSGEPAGRKGCGSGLVSYRRVSRHPDQVSRGPKATQPEPSSPPRHACGLGRASEAAKRGLQHGQGSRQAQAKQKRARPCRNPAPPARISRPPRPGLGQPHPRGETPAVGPRTFRQ
jgi:hypothetical protein